MCDMNIIHEKSRNIRDSFGGNTFHRFFLTYLNNIFIKFRHDSTAVTVKSFIHPKPLRMAESTCTYLPYEQEKEILSKYITNTNAESTVHAFMLQCTRSNKQPLFLLNWCVLGCKIVSSVCYLEASPSVETIARVAE